MILLTPTDKYGFTEYKRIKEIKIKIFFLKKKGGGGGGRQIILPESSAFKG